MTTQWRAGDGGPGRKYYELTPLGRRAFAQQASLWNEFARRTTTFIDSGATEVTE